MYLRMLLLSFGFPARDPFERAAQQALHRLHILIITVASRHTLKSIISKRAFGFAFLFALLIFYLGITFVASLFMMFALPIFAVFLCACFLGVAHPPKDWRLVHHVGLSQEAAVLSQQAGVPDMPVFIDLTKHGLYASVEWPIRRIVFSPIMADCASMVRKGIFAHELGHLLSPLGMLNLRDYRIMHAREFAADAVGACLLRDARPLLFGLVGLLDATPADQRFVWSLPSKSHPPLSERINRLLDLNMATRHAR